MFIDDVGFTHGSGKEKKIYTTQVSLFTTLDFLPSSYFDKEARRQIYFFFFPRAVSETKIVNEHQVVIVLGIHSRLEERKKNIFVFGPPCRNNLKEGNPEL